MARAGYRGSALYMVRFALGLSPLLIWLVSSVYISPGIGEAVCSLVLDDPNIDKTLTGCGDFILRNLGVTLYRFVISIGLVLLVSVALVGTLGPFSRGRLLLDGFGEAFRTIPATAWAFPLAVLPWAFMTSLNALYISTVLSTTPVLLVGMVRSYEETRSQPATILARRNGVNWKRRFFLIILPSWGLKLAVHVKITVALILIIVVVIESILQGGRLRGGVGFLMAKNFGGSGAGALGAEVLLLCILIAIGVVISILIDGIDGLLERYRAV